MWKRLCILILLALSMMMASCVPGASLDWAITEEPPLGDPLDWEKVAAQFGSGTSTYEYQGETPQIVVVTAVEESATLKDQLPPQHLDLVMNTDFSEAIIIAVYQGLKMTMGYSVEVTDVRRENRNILIYATFEEPDFGQPVGESVTLPYCIVKVAKTEALTGEFMFILMQGSDSVIQETHTIP